MQAGFGLANINPEPGVRMFGFAERDVASPCTGVHDDIFVRCCYLRQGDEQVLLAGFDLLFLGTDEIRQIREDLARELDLQPRQILLNTSHSHVGPRVGTWYWAEYTPPETAYVQKLRAAVVQAARQAKQSAKPARIMAGAGKSKVPMSRRKLHDDGRAYFEPNPTGFVNDHLPVCLLADEAGQTIALLFSVSCHPSMISGSEVSGEYTGAACRQLDRQVGHPAAVFLQGTGGDAKPAIVGDGPSWRSGSWEEVEQTGKQVAAEVWAITQGGLRPVEPDLHAALEVLQWPLLPHATAEQFAAMAADNANPEYKRRWAQRNLETLQRGEKLRASWPITLQAIQLGKGLRLVGLEGEAVARWGPFFLKQYPQGLTFPLGYTNGQGAYLPTSDILHEGGYEVDSFAEYWLPAQLGPGFEEIVAAALKRFEAQGVK